MDRLGRRQEGLGTLVCGSNDHELDYTLSHLWIQSVRDRDGGQLWQQLNRTSDPGAAILKLEIKTSKLPPVLTVATCRLQAAGWIPSLLNIEEG
jgi:hypothetical protein